MYQINGGAQVNVPLGSVILSPFANYTYASGSYSYTQQSSMSYTYPSGSGTVDGQGSLVFGFDALYTPLGVSLSSLMQNTDTYTLITVALRWLIFRR